MNSEQAVAAMFEVGTTTQEFSEIERDIDMHRSDSSNIEQQNDDAANIVTAASSTFSSRVLERINSEEAMRRFLDS